jgi:hypothetical protein
MFKGDGTYANGVWALYENTSLDRSTWMPWTMIILNKQLDMTLKNKIHNNYWSQIFKQKLNETSLKPPIKP